MTKLLQILTVLLFCPVAAYAQVDAATGMPTDPAASAPAAAVAGVVAGDVNKPFTGSFFLTPLEITAIEHALRGRVTKVPSQNVAVIPSRRVIRLSGVLYRSPSDWVVWMNNEKVTPKNLLQEIVDIKVDPSSKVHLEWYDVGLNQVLTITLRPHQTYDITTGILLPQ